MYVCTEGSASAHKIGSENKNLKVFQTHIVALFMTGMFRKSCPMDKIFPRTAAFSLHSETFHLYFHTKNNSNSIYYASHPFR